MTAISSEWVEIGDGLRGYYARPEGGGPFPAVLVYIEAFGVNDHFTKLAQRFASAGYVALVPDIYDGKIYEYSNLDGAVGHLKSLDDDTVIAQSTKALDYLAGRPEVNGDAICVTGYCMGGRYTFLANGALASRFKAAASFYGGGIAPVKDMVGRKPLLDQVPAMQAPIMMVYGADDQSIAPDEHGRIAEALGAGGKRYTMTVYPNAGHGFFCEDRQSYVEDVAEHSWAQMLNFFNENIGA